MGIQFAVIDGRAINAHEVQRVIPIGREGRCRVIFRNGKSQDLDCSVSYVSDRLNATLVTR